MKINILFFTIFSLLLSLATIAAEKKKTPQEDAEETIQFQTTVDPDVYSPKEFQKKSGHKTKALPEPGSPLLPSKENRDQVFTKVTGLAVEISAFDDLAKDLLYARAKTRGINELAKIYPKISQELLARLQKEILHSETTKK
jgi:hypothetical protein